MMRVLLISHSYMHRSPRLKLNLLSKFLDVELTVLVPECWVFRLEGFVKAGEEYQTPYHFKPLPPINRDNEQRYLLRGMGKVIKEFRPEIVHCENGPGAYVYFQANLLKRIFVPHAKSIVFSWKNLPYRIRRPWNWMAEQFNLKQTDCFIAGNEDAVRVHRERGYKGRFKVLPLWGIEPDFGKSVDPQDVRSVRTSLGLDSFVVGFLGRFVRAKGILTLIEATSKIQNELSVLLLGRGPLKSEIVELAARLGISDRVRFVDTVPHDEVPLYLNCMDVLVLPSLTTPPYAPSFKEQFGHVLIEAMSCEVPVIGSSSGEIPNVIGDAGLIFREGDADDLAEKLRIVMEDKGLRDELAKKGRQRVLEKYTHKKIAEETYKVYQELP